MTNQYQARLYAAYASTHAGLSDGASDALAFQRDIFPHLPEDRASTIVDVGCGQGGLVRELIAHGYVMASGFDISPEQVKLAQAAGITQVNLGDYRSALSAKAIDAVTATDFFEHLTREEVLGALDSIFDKLRPAGRLIIRVPNAVSPFGGNYRFGDMTHESSFTARSLRQAGAASGFVAVNVFECAPTIHGLKSAARFWVWKLASGVMKLSLAAETGVVRGHKVTQNIVAVMHKAEDMNRKNS